ncbi:selenoprotein domain-containing protein [Colletotrichum truncatum]|uniref:Selenoprotein domain-containing protein n=1 Tax=Colletotrichum truncatum TaxID=5467 RepID=A0ACC3YIM6_COLTU|nr:selenoprotein domain-containing protein [Colletotrichum truncatum]KAF6794385.1 selenoprotein domain-containing protein [Colletotrichum truncatum]
MTEVAAPAASQSSFPLPRVAIQFCTQCKWMLRAAYFAQELLSTFSTSLGEVALQPATGGTFTVTLTHLPEGATTTSTTIIWDRKLEGGFPETKELKRRVRDVIEPNRDLGHVDRKHSKSTATTTMPSEDNQKSSSGSFADNLPSASDVVSHLKKHPANASAKQSQDNSTTENSPFDDAARAAIKSAGANKGQQDRADVSPPGQNLGELRRQHQEQQQQQQQPTQGDKKEACEDCA